MSETINMLKINCDSIGIIIVHRLYHVDVSQLFRRLKHLTPWLENLFMTLES
jgi:hypothetical protein